MVVWLLFAVPWVFLQFVIVVFPDHTHLLFLHVVGMSINTKVPQMLIKSHTSPNN